MPETGRSRPRLATNGVVTLMGVTLASLSILAQQGPPGREFPADLGGADRKLLHIATDKPFYRPGETVYVRGLLLDAFTRAPVAKATTAAVEVRSPKGDIVTQFHASGAEDGVLAFTWSVPPGQPGGEYRLVVKLPWDGYPEAETTFGVRAYRVPRLKTELALAKKAYGPGDEVVATLTAERAEGGVPAGAKVTAVARVDGAEVHRAEATLDAGGRCAVRFQLPAEIAMGEGSLALTIEDGGVVETAAKTIPIVLAKVRLDLDPEGGDLVEGVESRLCLEARTPLGDPADVAGRIVAGDARARHTEPRTIASFRTEHEGRARVAFTPELAQSYEVAIDEPAGVTERFPVPVAKQAGVSLVVLDDAVAPGAPVRVRVAAGTLWPADGRVLVAVAQREHVIVNLDVALAPGEAKELSFPVDPKTGPAEGVLRVTAFDDKGRPLAERLIFRHPKRTLKLEVAADPGRTAPRGKVAVKVRATDATTGEPVEGAIVSLTAVDDAVLETVEKRDRAPRLPAQVLLGGEVNELKDAHVYLAGGAEGDRALDLLLGTQGWRRFALVDAREFYTKHGEAARRALALKLPPEPAEIWEGRAGGDWEEGLLLRAELRPRPMPAPPPEPTPAGVIPEMPADPAAAVAPEDPAVVEKQHAEAEAAAAEPMGRADRKRIRLNEDRDRARYVAYVREFAHRAPEGTKPGPRVDFAETLYWNAGARTGADGTIAFAFDAADSITTYRIRADGVSQAGALGAGDGTVEVRKPFYLEPKLPLEVTAGDRIEAPVAVVNGSSARIEIAVKAAAGAGITLASDPAVGFAVALDPDGRTRVYVPLEVGTANGEVFVRVAGSAGENADDVARTIAVVPAGFPIEMAFGGRLGPGGAVTHTIRIPESVEPSSIRGDATVFPTPLASLTEAVAALLREPGGCFEQTSMTSYPNVMVMRYLKAHPTESDPALVARAADLLDRGYKRLVGFECKEGGYEWFGGDPGHEALTAYGVLQFTDMAACYPVDGDMLGRTRKWLLARRNGKGGFERNSRALDSFGGAPEDVTDLYITWALTEAGEQPAEIAKEIANARERGQGTNDPYVMALAANILQNAGEAETAGAVLERLAKHQGDDGRVAGAATTFTRSGGIALELETTSLAVLAFVRAPAHTARLEKAMEWLLSTCKGGGFGSTQSTILALRAIVAYDEAHSKPKAAGTLVLSIDGAVVDEVPFGADHRGPIELPAFVKKLTPGAHEVLLRMGGGSDMPYSLVARYHAATPASSPACKLRLATALGRTEVREGETVDLVIELANATDEGLPMAVAVVGLPGGLEARPERLAELVRSGEIDAFETRGRELVFYRRCMAPRETRRLTIDLVAAIPGRYTAPASRAYLYYTAEDVQWLRGLAVTVAKP